jgi:hypothetical protein
MLPRGDPKIDIANGEKACELLGQSMSFENEVVSHQVSQPMLSTA